MGGHVMWQTAWGRTLRRGPWTGSWTGSPDNPSAAGVISAMTGAIDAARACAAREHALFYASVAAYAATTWADAIRCNRRHRRYEQVRGKRCRERGTDGFDDHPFPLCTVTGCTVLEMACVRSAEPTASKRGDGHPLNRQIRSVVSAGSAGAIYAYRRVGQRWRSGGSCESGLASSAGSEVVTVRLSHRARPAGQLI